MIAIFLALISGLVFIWKLQQRSSMRAMTRCEERSDRLEATMAEMNKAALDFRHVVMQQLLVVVEQNTISNKDITAELRIIKRAVGDTDSDVHRTQVIEPHRAEVGQRELHQPSSWRR